MFKKKLKKLNDGVNAIAKLTCGWGFAEQKRVSKKSVLTKALSTFERPDNLPALTGVRLAYPCLR